MQIEFVNHSSLIVHSDDIHLMCDFWKDGSVFDNSWDLLCETAFDYSDFAGVTHLWISHEHPDHFSPGNLRAIPEALRSNITVLFQHTNDKRVVSYCRKLGFRDVIELEAFQPSALSDEVEVTCAPYGASWADVDSWLLVKTPAGTFLNINDCEIETNRGLARIQQHCGDIDILATQFSFASKQGDKFDDEWMAKARAYHLDKLDLKLNAFNARYVIPFASFVYWSHIENRYLNKGMISVHEAVEHIESCGARPVVMYPSDRWSPGDEWDNRPALDRYQAHYDRVGAMPDSDYHHSDSVDPGALMSQAASFIDTMKKDNSVGQIRDYIALQHADIRTKGQSRIAKRMKALVAGLRGQYEHCRIYVEDHGQAYLLTLENGLTLADFDRADCHISIHSQALQFAFTVGFGGETLQINGRFNRIRPDGWSYISRIFYLARRIEQGLRLPRSVVFNAVRGSLAGGND